MSHRERACLVLRPRIVQRDQSAMGSTVYSDPAAQKQARILRDSRYAVVKRIILPSVRMLQSDRMSDLCRGQ